LRVVARYRPATDIRAVRRLTSRIDSNVCFPRAIAAKRTPSWYGGRAIDGPSDANECLTATAIHIAGDDRSVEYIQGSDRKFGRKSNDPAFAAKVADIVGLNLDPPDSALVLPVDKRPSIQALERAQNYLKLPNGHMLSGRSHDYRRHGAPPPCWQTLDIASSEVSAKHYVTCRRRRIELLVFMNRIVAMHPRVHFHFMPTRATWLNQIEIWFSILANQSERSGGSLTVPGQRKPIATMPVASAFTAREMVPPGAFQG
jgi:hypothetical protein